MKVAITFIGTNKYLDFFPKYYESVEKYFLPDAEKTFLVFTDGEIDDPPDNVKVYHQEHLEWPYITLKRFEILNKAREEIDKCDWLVFLDADTRVVAEVTEEDFYYRCCHATTDEVPLFGVHHPCHYLKMPPHDEVPGAYEQNPKSEAYVDPEEIGTPVMKDVYLGKYGVEWRYFQGCFWGGKVPAVCAMIDELEEKTNLDLEKGIVAVWHDESHINRYFHDHWFDVHKFGPEYAYPEVFQDHCNFEPKIVHLAKDNSAYQI